MSGSGYDDLRPTVRAMIVDSKAPTAPLDDWLAEYAEDDNLWWVLDCGHHQNLFEAAVERNEEAARAVVEAAEKLSEKLFGPPR